MSSTTSWITRAVAIAPPKLDAAGDRAPPQPRPARQEEEDDQDAEEHLDDRRRRRGRGEFEDRTRRRDRRGLRGCDRAGAARCRTVRFTIFLEARIEIEQRRDVRLDAVDPLGQHAEEFGRRHDDRAPARCWRRSGTAARRASAASGDGHAVPLQPFEHRHQRDRDHQRGGQRQEEFGARLAARTESPSARPMPAISVSAASSRSRRSATRVDLVGIARPGGRQPERAVAGGPALARRAPFILRLPRPPHVPLPSDTWPCILAAFLSACNPG